MATREENLKKINDELEKLDDEQLDKVAGGSLYLPFRPRMPRRNSVIGEDNPNTAPDSNQLGAKTAWNW